MSTDLDRFLRAQAGDFDRALAELTAGRKRSHWIWYVFPQLAGLGSSPMAEMYGRRGRDEAAAYLRHPTLRARLIDAARAALAPLQHQPPAGLESLMGSDIDALKLVSSMTLFREIARRVHDDEMFAVADGILSAAAEQGYRECEFTVTALKRP